MESQQSSPTSKVNTSLPATDSRGEKTTNAEESSTSSEPSDPLLPANAQSSLMNAMPQSPPNPSTTEVVKPVANEIHPSPSSKPTQVQSPLPSKAFARTQHLQTQITTLTSQILAVNAQLSATLSQLSHHHHHLPPPITASSSLAVPPPTDPETETQLTTTADLLPIAEDKVKQHIKLLHEYNAIRDVGMGLCGMIADSRGVRLKTILDEYGISSQD